MSIIFYVKMFIQKRLDKAFILFCPMFLAFIIIFTLTGCGVIRRVFMPFDGERIIYTRGIPHTLSNSELIELLKKTQVLLIGEIHDHPFHHKVQLDLLKAIEYFSESLIVGIEWLDHTTQSDCDQLSAGILTVEEFASQVNWDHAWGFALDLYAPILEFIRNRHLRLIALNAPYEVVHQVASNGLASLTLAQRSLLAPTLDLQDQIYRSRLAVQFFFHGLQGLVCEENFFVAQVVRDETMAHNLAIALQPWPDSGGKAVVLVGGGHLTYGEGLPPRISRRLPGVVLLTALSMCLDLRTNFSEYIFDNWPADILIFTASVFS